ncbi:hypothetical protein LA345_16100 [Burkholderia vietnamiensis]|uniref:Uncharacterized protein n=1 Tax=Burkholderia vietnamiensis (strain G4 / LMG 22486) TaxID=269482 RepID=A4JHB5_BURVG|nr:hypothetical protein Bcep1808_2676 [Burkholderia vietnamiensis G4]MCB4345426.1 hypothetical protein [Burkholderia vietnamiensis]
MKKFLDKIFGSDGTYNGKEVCSTCEGPSTKWKMIIKGDNIWFYELSPEDTWHEFSKQELEQNDNEFYFYEDGRNLVETSIEKPTARRFERVKILFGKREVRILGEGRNIVFHKAWF